jgi:hypothetical protein
VIVVLPQAGTPGWTYSIGLFQNYHHPEIVVFGLQDTLAHPVLNAIANDIRSGKHYEPDSQYHGLLEGVRCTFKPVAKMWHRPFLGWAEWFYNGADYPVLQWIWPDKTQHYPWEPLFRADWLWAQPLLFHTSPDDARATQLLNSLKVEPGPGDPR